MFQQLENTKRGRGREGDQELNVINASLRVNYSSSLVTSRGLLLLDLLFQTAYVCAVFSGSYS